jgi:hypothetical protein
MAQRKESAADIVVSLENENDIVVDSLSLTKEIDIETIYGSGRTLPDAYSINQISYQGSMELMGNKLELEEHLFDDNGVPVEATINITHFNGELTSFTQVLCTSEGYEMSSGDTTTTSFEFIAMGKEHAGNADTEPTGQ